MHARPHSDKEVMSRLFLSAVAICLAAAVSAGPIEDSIERQLRAQGFDQITVTRTWLGRSRFVAQSDELYREIIVNPVTGEILRDYTRRQSGEGGLTLFAPGGESGSRRNGGENDRDDDDDDDDAGYGNSGESDGGDSDGGDSDGGDSDGGGGDDD